MNTKRLNNWAGLFSIIWMLGGYAFFSLLDGLDFEPSWFVALMISLSWLSVGIIFAVIGLMRGSLAGRICGIVAIGVLIFFVWWMMTPVIKRGHQRSERSNWKIARSSLLFHCPTRQAD